MLQKFYKLVDVYEPRSARIGSKSHYLRLVRELVQRNAQIIHNESKPSCCYLSLSNILNAARAVSCCSATEGRRDDSAAAHDWAAGRGGLRGPARGLSYCEHELDTAVELGRRWG